MESQMYIYLNYYIIISVIDVQSLIAYFYLNLNNFVIFK